MAAVRLRAALNTAMAISRLGNVFLQDSAPWVTLKTDRAAAGTTIAVAVNLVRLLSVILEPFMPGFADKICHQLAMDHGDIPDEWTCVAAPCVCVCPVLLAGSDAGPALSACGQRNALTPITHWHMRSAPGLTPPLSSQV